MRRPFLPILFYVVMALTVATTALAFMFWTWGPKYCPSIVFAWSPWPDPVIRAYAVHPRLEEPAEQAIMKFGPAAIPAILHLFGDERYRLICLYSLDVLREESLRGFPIAEKLADGCRSNSEDVRSWCARILSRVKSEDSARLLVTLAADQSEKVRIQTILGLELNVENQEVRRAIAELILDDNERISALAIDRSLLADRNLAKKNLSIVISRGGEKSAKAAKEALLKVDGSVP
jgi:hypothetical protein